MRWKIKNFSLQGQMRRQVSTSAHSSSLCHKIITWDYSKTQFQTIPTLAVRLLLVQVASWSSLKAVVITDRIQPDKWGRVSPKRMLTHLYGPLIHRPLENSFQDQNHYSKRPLSKNGTVQSCQGSKNQNHLWLRQKDSESQWLKKISRWLSSHSSTLTGGRISKRKTLMR